MCEGGSLAGVKSCFPSQKRGVGVQTENRVGDV